MTDPVADFLTRLRNANSAYHESISLPYSKLKAGIAEILKAEGYVGSVKVEDAEVGKTLVVDLKYGANRERTIVGIKRVSKPGLRIYRKSDQMPKVLGGVGVAVVVDLALRLEDAGRQGGDLGADTALGVVE